MTAEDPRIRQIVIELCEEDDYGSWELLWALSADAQDVPRELLAKKLADVVETLVTELLIVTMIKKTDNNFRNVKFSKARLLEQLRDAHDPDPDTFYWFGTP